MKDNIIKKCYLAAFDINDKNLKDLMIINTKCLVDDGKNRYVYIDSNRLKDELIYYRFYGEIPSYNSILNLILPAILANTNIDRSQDEAISLIQKYAKYLKKEVKMFDYILGSVIYNSIISTILNILYDIYIEDREVENEGIKSIKKSILSILGDEIHINIDNIDFVSSMSEYITKLRSYKINKKIYSKTSDPRELIKLNEGDVYIDSIFNQIKVISKEFSENILSIKIKAKSGIYVLKFKKS